MFLCQGTSGSVRNHRFRSYVIEDHLTEVTKGYYQNISSHITAVTTATIINITATHFIRTLIIGGYIIKLICSDNIGSV